MDVSTESINTEAAANYVGRIPAKGWGLVLLGIAAILLPPNAIALGWFLFLAIDIRESFRRAPQTR